MDAVRTIGLSKTFGKRHAVSDLTIRIAPGEIFGLVGPDGAGKTTTLRLLTAILEPTSGDAWVMDKHVVADAEAIKEEIGYVSQRFGLYPDLTVTENIEFYADIYGVSRKSREQRMRELLAFSNLTPFRRRQAGNLSGGMKQKLGLSCALIHTPKLLFLDEPTNGVDPVSRLEFWRLLYRLLKEGVTIVVSTAYLDEAERCGRVGLLHKGRLLACDTPDRIKGLMRGTILEVRTDQARRAAALLKARLPSDSVSLFGDRIHVVTQDPDRTAQEVTALLARADLAFRDPQSVAPTLEDVFVSVLADDRNATDESPL